VQSNTPLALESVAHLSESHREYFIQWSRMLRLEWEETIVRSRSLSSIWCIDPRVREEQGHCISHMKVCKFFVQLLCIFIKDLFNILLQVKTFLPSVCSTSELDQYVITLWLGDGISLPPHVNLQRGDSVVISTNIEVAVATGCIIEINSHLVTVSTDRNLKNWTRSIEVIYYFFVYTPAFITYFKSSLGFTLGQIRISRRAVFYLLKSEPFDGQQSESS